jgi:DMSO/TMAO reductase YedYZ molybdopterin-dependent catalytic subunit
MLPDPDSSNATPLPVHEMPAMPEAQEWELVLRNDDRVVRLDISALGRLPHVELVDTFTCLAGWTAGPLRWRGVRLSTLLDKLAGADGGWLAVSAPDFRSVVALEHLPDETLLADSLDGRPLPQEHGGPVRLVIPGGVCYQSVKWVQCLEVQDSDAGDTARAIALARLSRKTL